VKDGKFIRRACSGGLCLDGIFAFVLWYVFLVSTDYSPHVTWVVAFEPSRFSPPQPTLFN
jgi:hypothetical protein